MTNSQQLHRAALLVDRYTARAREATAERNQLIVEAMKQFRSTPTADGTMTPASIASMAQVSVRYVHELAPLDPSAEAEAARRAQLTIEEEASAVIAQYCAGGADGSPVS
jgi:hypothetical protein